MPGTIYCITENTNNNQKNILILNKLIINQDSYLEMSCLKKKRYIKYALLQPSETYYNTNTIK